MKNTVYSILAFASMLAVFAFTSKDEVSNADTAGAMAFKKYSCTSCHGTTGKAIADLTNAWRKYNDGQIRDYIRKPITFNNRKMPPFAGIINENDLDVLVEYVKFLGKR